MGPVAPPSWPLLPCQPPTASGCFYPEKAEMALGWPGKVRDHVSPHLQLDDMLLLLNQLFSLACRECRLLLDGFKWPEAPHPESH